MKHYPASLELIDEERLLGGGTCVGLRLIPRLLMMKIEACGGSLLWRNAKKL